MSVTLNSVATADGLSLNFCLLCSVCDA